MPGGKSARGQDVHDLDFPPIRNGIDYLVSVVDHLTAQDVGPRSIKYAVLHLHAATEVLLKARLVQEHWSLVFDDPGHATADRFKSGDFKSCTVEEAVRRLRSIAGVTITGKEESALADLGRDRNALQHYGLTHNARAVEARAGRLLDFLVRFLDDILVPNLGIDEEDDVVLEMMIHIKVGLDGIQTFGDQRLRRLRGTLRGYEERTFHCPECSEMTMVTDGTSSRCHFCGLVVPTAEQMIRQYLFGHPEPESMMGTCPRCTQPTAVKSVPLATGDYVTFCFGCPGPVPGADAPAGADAEGAVAILPGEGR